MKNEKTKMANELDEKSAAILELVAKLANTPAEIAEQAEKEFYRRNGENKAIKAIFTLAECLRFERLANKYGITE